MMRSTFDKQVRFTVENGRQMMILVLLSSFNVVELNAVAMSFCLSLSHHMHLCHFLKTEQFRANHI